MSGLATKVHKTLHSIDTDEIMVCRTIFFFFFVFPPVTALIHFPAHVTATDLREGAHGTGEETEIHHGQAELVSCRVG